MPTGQKEFSDEELLAKIIEGDSPSFAALVHRHNKRYYALAYRFLNNKSDAEDIVQEAFLKIWQQPKRWDPKRQTKFTTWMYRVVLNLVLDWNKRKTPVALSKKEYPCQVCNEKQEEKRKEESVAFCFQKLPERQKIAINLCFYEGLSNKEAAAIMEVKLKALESLLMRGKKALRTCLQKHLTA